MSEQPTSIDPRVAPQPAPVETPTVRSPAEERKGREWFKPAGCSTAHLIAHSDYSEFPSRYSSACGRPSEIGSLTFPSGTPTCKKCLASLRTNDATAEGATCASDSDPKTTQPPPQPAAEERVSEPSEIAIMAATRIMVNTDNASKACNGPRFHFTEYRDEQAREVQRAIDETLTTLRPVDAGDLLSDIEMLLITSRCTCSPSPKAKYCTLCRARAAFEKLSAPVATAGVSDGERDTQRLDWLENYLRENPTKKLRFTPPLSSNAVLVLRDFLDAAMTTPTTPAPEGEAINCPVCLTTRIVGGKYGLSKDAPCPECQPPAQSLSQGTTEKTPLNAIELALAGQFGPISYQIQDAVAALKRENEGLRERVAGGWKPMDEAPQDGTLIQGLYDCGPILIRWAEQRRCMLAGVGGGNGYFGPGWEDDENHLEVDAPMAWRGEDFNDDTAKLREELSDLDKENGQLSNEVSALESALRQERETSTKLRADLATKDAQISASVPLSTYDDLLAKHNAALTECEGLKKERDTLLPRSHFVEMAPMSREEIDESKLATLAKAAKHAEERRATIAHEHGRIVLRCDAMEEANLALAARAEAAEKERDDALANKKYGWETARESQKAYEKERAEKDAALALVETCRKALEEDGLAWLKTKLAEAESSLRAREQMAQTLKSGSDASWAAAAKLHPTTASAPPFTKADRLKASAAQTRISANCLRDVTMLRRIITALADIPVAGSEKTL